MRPKLTAPTYDQRLAEEARQVQLAHDAKHAPGPKPIECAGCGESIHGGYGVDFKLYCADCADRPEWLAGTREHAARLREVAHG